MKPKLLDISKEDCVGILRNIGKYFKLKLSKLI